ncbi:tRNA-splicing endonuclease, SEN34 subunit [Ascosphaera apis ARSEF 7405]|uniref:tRNA-splicing endonuclease subunit Sen34 n=1 Tax=Ascosphaera apis ARSEF 7405 TaxID=392613 RepID=A0A167X0D6_9EURO|nr:tRNA-splicing endonuclease, SEN34 subunit [Ascosphaera apis ARSEF 7405]
MEQSLDLPIPISLIADQYLLFSIDAVTYLRREHHICGVLSGTLPQVPQQNVFLGLPLELMPEEARLLVDKGVAYIIDDAEAHQRGMAQRAEEDRRSYLDEIRRHGQHAASAQASRKEQQRLAALQKQGKKLAESVQKEDSNTEVMTAADSLFSSSPANTSSSSRQPDIPVEPAFGVTPATSTHLIRNPPPDHSAQVPSVPPSYPLFAHLHSQGYYLSPGLRFGCQYLAYPGDPLRFHSHFLAVHSDWDEEIDLMDLVVGGRLGTGVKKGFLIGGEEEQMDDDKVNGTTRVFSLEWAGM